MGVIYHSKNRMLARMSHRAIEGLIPKRVPLAVVALSLPPSCAMPSPPSLAVVGRVRAVHPTCETCEVLPVTLSGIQPHSFAASLLICSQCRLIILYTENVGERNRYRSTHNATSGRFQPL